MGALSPYRVAIVGLGRMGSTIDDEFPAGSAFLPYSVAAACRASERLEVVSGADIDPQKRAAFRERWGVPAVYADYLEMIQNERPDLVAICTRGPLHAEMTVAVAEAGVGLIYCEKAMAGSVREADRVRAAVKRHGALFNTGVLRRFDNRYAHARQLIARGEIGEPRAIVHFAASNLLHGHIHSLDTLSYLLGDPPIERVWGELSPPTLEIRDNRLEKDPNATYRVLFAGGITGVSVPAGNWEFEVLGTKGSLRLTNNGTGGALRTITAERSAGFIDRPYETPAPYSATRACLEDLVAAREQGRPTLGNVDLAHHLTEACLAVAESHRTGQTVTLPLANRELYIAHV